MEVIRHPVMDDDIVSTLGEIPRKFIRELHRLTTYVKTIDFLREVVRIPGANGTIRYKLTRANLALNFCMALNLNIFLEIPRRLSAIVGIQWLK